MGRRIPSAAGFEEWCKHQTSECAQYNCTVSGGNSGATCEDKPRRPFRAHRPLGVLVYRVQCTMTRSRIKFGLPSISLFTMERSRCRKEVEGARSRGSTLYELCYLQLRPSKSGAGQMGYTHPVVIITSMLVRVHASRWSRAPIDECQEIVAGQDGEPTLYHFVLVHCSVSPCYWPPLSVFLLSPASLMHMHCGGFKLIPESCPGHTMHTPFVASTES